jgi:hypothetical protein
MAVLLWVQWLAPKVTSIRRGVRRMDVRLKVERFQERCVKISPTQVAAWGHLGPGTEAVLERPTHGSQCNY